MLLTYEGKPGQLGVEGGEAVAGFVPTPCKPGLLQLLTVLQELFSLFQ